MKSIINISDLKIHDIFLVICEKIINKEIPFLYDNKDNIHFEYFKNIKNRKTRVIFEIPLLNRIFYIDISGEIFDDSFETKFSIYLKEDRGFHEIRIDYLKNKFELKIDQSKKAKIVDEDNIHQLKTNIRHIYLRLKYFIENFQKIKACFSSRHFNNGCFKIESIYRLKPFIDKFKLDDEIKEEDIQKVLKFFSCHLQNGSGISLLRNVIRIQKVDDPEAETLFFRILDKVWPYISIKRIENEEKEFRIIRQDLNFLKFLVVVFNMLGGEVIKRKILIQRIEKE